MAVISDRLEGSETGGVDCCTPGDIVEVKERLGSGSHFPSSKVR